MPGVHMSFQIGEVQMLVIIIIIPEKGRTWGPTLSAVLCRPLFIQLSIYVRISVHVGL